MKRQRGCHTRLTEIDQQRQDSEVDGEDAKVVNDGSQQEKRDSHIPEKTLD